MWLFFLRLARYQADPPRRASNARTPKIIPTIAAVEIDLDSETGCSGGGGLAGAPEGDRRVPDILDVCSLMNN